MTLNTLEIAWQPSLAHKRSNILVLGAEGFIGKNIEYWLEDKYYLFTPTHKQLDLNSAVQVDKYFQDRYFDVVIHCASVGGRRNKPDLRRHFDINYNMFANILNNKEHYKYLINIGSGADRLGTWYGKSKRVIAHIIKEHKNMVNLRCFGVWGNLEAKDRFPTYCQTHDSITIEDKMMRFIHVDDLVKIIDVIIQKWPNKREYTLGEPVKLSDFAKAINPKIKITISGQGQDYI